MRTIAMLVAAALVVAAPSRAGADDRPAVTVRFVLADPNYKVKFSDADRPGVEAAAAMRLAQRLSDRIGFVRFTTQGDLDTVLTFELNRQDPRGTSDIRELGFHVTLRRQGQAVSDSAYVMFRPQTESAASIPDRDALLEAIGAKVAEASGPRGPITALLSGLPIAHAAVFMKSPLGWAIPYRHDDLCMDEASVVLLSNTIDSPAATVVHQFTARASGRLKDGEPRGRILGEPDPASQAHLDELINAPPEQVRVDAVYVVQYAPRTPCDAVVAPAPR